MSQLLTQASHQWASRPDDQRFLSLAELKAHVGTRRNESWTATPAVSDMRIVPDDSGKIGVDVYDPSFGSRRVIEPSHFGFGQLSQYASCPAAYLRTLPAELAAINLQWGLEHNPMRDDALVLAQSNGHNTLRAITSTSYGRIWDAQVVDAVEKVNVDGRWVIPSASYTATNPLRATTLYASDRDVFIFLVDPSHPIEVPGEAAPKFRGFFAWNSEVGAGTFGIATFLYDHVCDNRMVWGATQVRELRIRHTGGAPDRFAYEGAKYLRQYGEESTVQIVNQIGAAKRMELDIPKEDGVAGWLQKRGFTKAVAKGAEDQVNMESGARGNRSLWAIVNGVTAYARSVPFTNERIELETKAGKLMDLVA